MALLIVIPLINANSLNDRLNKLAPYNWADDRNIYALPIDESQGRQRNAERIAAYCQDHDIKSILILDRVHCGEVILRSADYQIIRGPSIDNLLLGDGLQKQLRSLHREERLVRVGQEIGIAFLQYRFEPRGFAVECILPGQKGHSRYASAGPLSSAASSSYSPSPARSRTRAESRKKSAPYQNHRIHFP